MNKRVLEGIGFRLPIAKGEATPKRQAQDRSLNPQPVLWVDFKTLTVRLSAHAEAPNPSPVLGEGSQSS